VGASRDWRKPTRPVARAAEILLLAIRPGLTETSDWINRAKELTSGKGGDWQGYLQSVADEHAAIKRFASAEELAHFFVFLCSGKATYSVGSTYCVDGGMLKTV
jgi:NAD(P)-dependent dehydrogenase (short-subunit alcohol dehydrogenase family)